MAYNKNTYLLIFLPLAVLLYHLTPKKYRYLTLLAMSSIFFWSISGPLFFWAVYTTVITWAGGVLMDGLIRKNRLLPRELRSKPKELKKRLKRIAGAAVFAVVFALAALKYTNFTIELVASLIQKFCQNVTPGFAGMGSGPATVPVVSIAAPIGVSFYTLQAVGYLLDVCWGRIEAEQNPLKVMLFMIFFPTLMEGPILRWEDAREQMFAGEDIHEVNLVLGSFRIGWGLFKRMLISDRLNTAVGILFQPNSGFEGIMIFMTGVIVTVQLYLEFSGTIDIVLGSAQLFGIRLPENFRQPFLAKSAAEFWRRWHISLGSWFKNYIFYPVSASGLMKKWNKFGRKHLNSYVTMVVTSAICLFPVWMLNGIWHGPKWPYILYGVYYFLILLAEVMMEPLEKRLAGKLSLAWDGGLVTALRRIRTILIVLIGETLFRADTLADFGTMMKNLFTVPFRKDFPEALTRLGLDTGDWYVIIIGCIVVFIVEGMMEKEPELFTRLPERPVWQRWPVYYALIFSIVIFGAYGDGYLPVNLIYAGF